MPRPNESLRVLFVRSNLRMLQVTTQVIFRLVLQGISRTLTITSGKQKLETKQAPFLKH